MNETKKLASCSLLVALATVLAAVSMVLPLSLPFGGSVTLASCLPIIAAGYLYGVRSGLWSGAVFAVIQMFLGGATVSSFFMPGDAQMVWWRAVLVCVIDYLLAYTALGLGGIFRRRIKSTAAALCLGSIVALTVKYLLHVISGAVFFGAYAEWFFTDVAGGTLGESVLAHLSGAPLAVVYSVVYNGLYMIPEIILTAVVAAAISGIVRRYKQNHEGKA